MFLSFLLKTSLTESCCRIIDDYANSDVYLYIHISLHNYECMTSCLVNKTTWEYIKEQSQYIYNEPCIYNGTSDGIDIKIESDVKTIMSNITVSYDSKDIMAFKKLYPNRRFVGNFNIIREIFKKCIQYQQILNNIYDTDLDDYYTDRHLK